MKLKRHVVVGAVVLLLTLVLSAIASAAGRVGVIDLALIIDESKAGRQANTMLNAFIEERRQQLLPLETQLQELVESLENGVESMSDEERAALEAEIDTLAEEYVSLLEQFQTEVEAAAQSLREQLLADIGVVLQMVGDSRGFDLIIDTSTAYYYRRVVDLTFEVIREYDDLWEAAQRQSTE